jgi:hypothetical protein
LPTQPLLATTSSSLLSTPKQYRFRRNEDPTRCLSSFQLK